MSRTSELLWMPPEGSPRRAALLSLVALLRYAAVAVMIGWGLRIAGLVLEWKRAPQAGLTPGIALEVLAILPGLAVLLAYLRLGQVLQRPALSRSAAWMFGSSWVGALLAAVPSKGGDDMEAVVGLLLVAAVLTHLGCSIWFDVTLISSRGELGPLAGWLGALGLVDTAVWVLFKAVLLAGLASAAGRQPDADTDQLFDQVRPLDHADTIRALVSRTALSLLTAGLFLSLRQQLSAGNEAPAGRARP